MKQNANQFLTLLSLLILMGNLSKAQSIAIQSVNSMGVNMSQSSASLSFTVGELVVLSQTDSQGNNLGGGFTSGATISTVSIEEVDASLLDVTVFPNPSAEWINIQVTHANSEPLIATLVDMQGKEVYRGKFDRTSDLKGIDMQGHLPGAYVLSLKNLNGKGACRYKIVKR